MFSNVKKICDFSIAHMIYLMIIFQMENQKKLLVMSQINTAAINLIKVILPTLKILYSF